MRQADSTSALSSTFSAGVIDTSYTSLLRLDMSLYPAEWAVPLLAVHKGAIFKELCWDMNRHQLAPLADSGYGFTGDQRGSRHCTTHSRTSRLSSRHEIGPLRRPEWPSQQPTTSILLRSLAEHRYNLKLCCSWCASSNPLTIRICLALRL